MSNEKFKVFTESDSQIQDFLYSKEIKPLSISITSGITVIGYQEIEDDANHKLIPVPFVYDKTESLESQLETLANLGFGEIICQDVHIEGTSGMLTLLVKI